MIDMQHYRDVSERVAIRAICREELIAMAEQREQKQRRPVMRKAAAAVLAAALAVGGMTVAVGAANNWDYQSIFTKFFSDKSEQEVSYDFSRIGQNIDLSNEYPFGTLTVESALVTPYAMYLSWDVQLNDTVQIADGDTLWNYVTVSNADNLMGTHAIGTPGDDGAYHFAGVFKSTETPITEKELTFESGGLLLIHADGSEDKMIQNGTFEDMEKLTFTPVISAEPAMTKLDTAVELTDQEGSICSADYVSVSPIAVILADEFGSKSDALRTASASVEAPVDIDLSVRYADGTVLDVNTDDYCTIYFSTRSDLPRGQRFYLLFDAPIETEGITAIRVNGTEIPLQ